jgi:hypothetical protein
MKVDDEAEGLVGIAGMTAEQFAAQTAALGDEFEMPVEPDDTGPIVLRADYDTVIKALAKEAPDLAALTYTNRSIANALLYVPSAGRLFAKFRSLRPDEITISERFATESTIGFKIERING